MRYVPPANPWEVPPLDETELMALKALKEGVASQYQQILALKVIVQKFAATYDMSFRPGAPDVVSFAEGKRFVGNRIIEAIDRPMKAKGTPNAGTNSTDPGAEAGNSAGRRNPKPGSNRGKPGA